MRASAAELIPAGGGVKALREAASECRACPLWRDATQTVFGAGAARAPVMLVGEQPGDREDREGLPFVGPAGQLLDRALACAGIEPRRTYRTNVVKHFKWKPRGKRRIHQTPSKLDVEACRPWLEAEFARVKPNVVGILGATAAKATPSVTRRLRLGHTRRSSASPESISMSGRSAIAGRLRTTTQSMGCPLSERCRARRASTQRLALVAGA